MTSYTYTYRCCDQKWRRDEHLYIYLSVCIYTQECMYIPLLVGASIVYISIVYIYTATSTVAPLLPYMAADVPVALVAALVAARECRFCRICDASALYGSGGRSSSCCSASCSARVPLLPYVTARRALSRAPASLYV